MKGWWKRVREERCQGEKDWYGTPSVWDGDRDWPALGRIGVVRCRLGLTPARTRARGRMVDMSTGEELIEERRRRRRAGDPRLTRQGRELFRRMTTGDLVDEFQDALDTTAATDPLIGGGDGSDD
jgi:hypothetical protein